MEGEFSTLVATFTGPVGTDEGEFERLLWNLLQRLHDFNFRQNCWDHTVSDDPNDPQFSFSFAAHGFFVVGLHPASSRFTRPSLGRRWYSMSIPSSKPCGFRAVSNACRR